MNRTQIFEDTKLPLRKWFAAIWLITSHKKGIEVLAAEDHIDEARKRVEGREPKKLDKKG